MAPIFYSRNASLPFPLPGSPSLIPNNLSLREDGAALAFVRLNEVIYMSAVGRNDHHKIPAAAKSQLCQTAFVHVHGGNFLVIVSTTGAYIWSADGSSMLFFVALSALAEGDLEYQFMRGIAGSATTIFLGTSLGQIVEVAVPNSTGECGIEVTSTVTISKYPIGCIGTCDSFLVVGDENGDIQGFQISPRLRDHPLFSRPGQGYPCTSILIKSDSVIAAFTSGHIRGYRISTGEQVIELTAHVRCITGLVLHPYENIFASVAEDQYVCVWSFSDFSSKNTKSIELLCAEKLDNHLCTGLCYFEDDRIGVTSYDEDEVVVLQRIP